MSEITNQSPRNSSLTFSLIANAILAIATLAFAFLYFQTSRDLDGQKATVAALQTETSSVKSDLAKEAARAAELKSDLNVAKTDAQSLAAKSTQLQADLESKDQALAQNKAALDKEKAKLPPVPVSIAMRPSAVNRGLVAVLTNTSTKQLPILLLVVNPTTRQKIQLSLQIAPGKKLEIGHQEGWQFASGDIAFVRSSGYEDLRITVP